MDGTALVEQRLEVDTTDHLVAVACDRPLPLDWDIQDQVGGRERLHPRGWLRRTRKRASWRPDSDLYWVRPPVFDPRLDGASPAGRRWRLDQRTGQPGRTTPRT